MEIFYCDKCGYKLSDDDIAAGNGIRMPDGQVLCPKCAPPGSRKTPAKGAPAARATPKGVSRGTPGGTRATPRGTLRNRGSSGYRLPTAPSAATPTVVSEAQPRAVVAQQSPAPTRRRTSVAPWILALVLGLAAFAGIVVLGLGMGDSGRAEKQPPAKTKPAEPAK